MLNFVASQSDLSARVIFFFFFQAVDGIRDSTVTGVQACALPLSTSRRDLVKGAAALEHFLDRYSKDPRASVVRGDLGLAYLDHNIIGRALRVLGPILESQTSLPLVSASGQIGRAPCRERV